MGQDIDYRNVEYDPGKPRPEWSYQARRAYLLEQIQDKGHPDFVNQAELARQFEKSRSTLTRDLQAVREFVVERVDEKRLDFIGSNMYEAAIKDAIENEEWDKADRMFRKYTEFLDARGLADYLPEDTDEDDIPDSVGSITMEVAGVSDMEAPADPDADGEDEDEDDRGPPVPQAAASQGSHSTGDPNTDREA